MPATEDFYYQLDKLSSPALRLTEAGTVLAINSGLSRLLGADRSGKLVNSGQRIQDLNIVLLPKDASLATWHDLLAVLNSRTDDKYLAKPRPATPFLDQTDTSEVSNLTNQFWDDEDDKLGIYEVDVMVQRGCLMYSQLASPCYDKRSMVKARLRIRPETNTDDVSTRSFLLVFLRPSMPALLDDSPLKTATAELSAVAGRANRSTSVSLTGTHSVTSDPNYIGLFNDLDESNVHEVISHIIPSSVAIADADGMVMYWSPSWYNYTGMTPEESRDNNWMQTVHPEDLSPVIEQWALAVTSNADDCTIQARYRGRDGRYMYFLSRCQPLRDNHGNVLRWLVSMLDVDELVLARMESDRRTESFVRLLSHVDVSMSAMNQDRQLTLFEGALCWCHDDPAQSKQKAEGHISKLAALGDVLAGKISSHTVEHQVDDRWFRTRLVADRTSVVNDKDATSSVTAVLALTTDVTDVRVRARLKSENERLVMNEGAAKEASKLKSQFLANMSHEIRTPIAGIIGLNSLLLQTALNEEQQELSRGLQHSAVFLLTLVNDVLDFSKIEAGHMDIEAVPFDLSEVIQGINQIMSLQALQKGLTLNYEAKFPPGVLIGDPGRIRQVLTNCLSNAVKFTSVGSISLSIFEVSDAEIRIKDSPQPAAMSGSRSKRQGLSRTSSSLATTLEFVIEDTGVGIDSKNLPKLFSAFMQHDSSTARRFGGTGLGLNISKQLVELMGGQIHLSSELGQGTKVSFQIPFRRSDTMSATVWDTTNVVVPSGLETEASIHLKEARLNSASPLIYPLMSIPDTETCKADLLPSPMLAGKGHILIVEDNAVNRMVALKMVAKLGYTTTAVWNGDEALTYLSGVSTSSAYHAGTCIKPDLILMDCQMPVMDGFEATSRLRRKDDRTVKEDSYCRFSDAIRLIPVIAVTASAIKGDREQCKAVGMNDWLTKPLGFDSLQRMLEKWIPKTGV